MDYEAKQKPDESEFLALIKKIFKKMPHDFLQVFSFDILSKFFMGVISIVIIRNLAASEYAQYIKFTTLSNFILGVFGTGIALSFVRYSAEMISRKEENKVINLHVLSLMVLLLVFITSLITIPLLSKVYATTVLVILLALIHGFILSINKLNQFYYQAKEAYVKSGILDSLRNVILCSLLIIMFLIDKNVDAKQILFSYLACGIITLVIGLRLIYGNVRCLKIAHTKDFKLMLKESFWLIIYSSIISLFNQMDVVMLSNLNI